MAQVISRKSKMKLRNRYELELMRKSGKIASAALKKAIETIKVGVTELEVDNAARDEIYRLGGDLSYKSVPGYNYATCVTVNEQVVHGIPTTRKFEEGDLVSVDLAVIYKGWHTDCAWSVLVGDSVDQSFSLSEDQEEQRRFLKVGEEALWEAVAQATPGKRVGDISNAIQTKVEGAGYSIVRSLVGHGVGRSLHEKPEIPGFGHKDEGAMLRKDMTIAIEVIYAMGSREVVLEQDGWTFSTADKSLGGLFEMTVIVGLPEVLTHL